MKKMITTIALVAAAGLVGSGASAQVGTYPGGLPHETGIIGSPGSDHYPGHWSYGGPNAAPTNLPVAVLDAQRAAIWGAYGSRGVWGGDRRRTVSDRGRSEEIRRLGEVRDGGDVLLRTEH